MIAQVTTNGRVNPYDEVAALADMLGKGETRRFICPKCSGGYSHEQSFCVTHTDIGRIFYCCFRASCRWKGTLLSGRFVGGGIELPYNKKIRKLERPLDELNEDQLQWWRKEFGMSPDCRTLYCDSREMFAYKVLGPFEEHRGWQLRTHFGEKKCDNYVHRDGPFISWYKAEKRVFGGVVIVEDPVSARKVSICGVDACALLGTSLDYERAYEIGENSNGFVIIALDRGTISTAISYRQRYECLWGSVEIWALDKDLKYVDKRRIAQGLYEGKSDFISVP